MKHLPNVLSIGRIVLTPAFLVLFLSGGLVAQTVALVLFIIGAVSDWADGALARKLNARTRLGQFLDPLADKVLVLGAFFALFFLPADADGRVIHAAWWWIPVAAIALRDVAVTLLRGWAERSGRTVQTKGSAKAKTTVQLTFLIALQVFMIGSQLPEATGVLGGLGAFAAAALYGPAPDVVLVFTALMTVWTGFLYFRKPSLESAADVPATPGEAA